MRTVALVLGVAVASFALSGCTPGVPVEPSPEPTAEPSAEPSEAVAPSPSVSAEPEGLLIPDTCGELVPIGWIQEQFGPDVVEFETTGGVGSEDVEEFRDRGGLACMWGLPASEFGVTVFVAPRATATDVEQVALWEAAGYALGPDFLDATYFETVANEFQDHTTVWTLVEGFELMSQTPTPTVDTALLLLREATTNMGY